MAFLSLHPNIQMKAFIIFRVKFRQADLRFELLT